MYQVLKYSFLASVAMSVVLAIAMEINPNTGWTWWVPFAPVAVVGAIIAVVFLAAVLGLLTARNPWQ